MTIICVICTEPLRANENFSVTSCGHTFHNQCIKQWIQRSQTCPQCRKVCTKKDLRQLFLQMTDQGAQDVENNLKQKEKELKDEKKKYDALNKKYKKKVSACDKVLREVQILRSDKLKSSKTIVDMENKLSEIDSILVTQNKNYKEVITANSQMKIELTSLRASKANFEKTIVDLKNHLSLETKANDQMERELRNLQRENENLKKQNTQSSTNKLSNKELTKQLEIMKRKCKERENTVEMLRREMELMCYYAENTVSNNDYLERSRHNERKQQKSTKWIWFLLAAGSLAFLYKRIKS
ncbi:E3 ubiquitin-protein ligase TRAIP-like [Lutzomyia longipalpis]|uniref:E3 ubiquitin-protein ligase TRAIP-like n=1 Tax=Lutzomyia longipalpis TaxID=7200 RepID=UPI00248457B2|nr:E3 ubiquitin-protein ligase TRAIP-like [Lutzomyia longipalpis]